MRRKTATAVLRRAIERCVQGACMFAVRWRHQSGEIEPAKSKLRRACLG